MKNKEMQIIPMVDLKAQYKSLKKEIDNAIAEVFKNCQFILGENVRRLEEEITKYVGVKYAIGVASGTDALILALESLEIGKGDEVITTPFTFIATAEAITRVGAKPVFVDIEEKTYNIDVEKIEEKINKRTKVIIPVHLYGQSADMDEIMRLAKKYKLKVVEDAAQSLGAEYKGKKLGSWGDLGCISFYPSKNLGAYGDGGMIITNNKKVKDMISLLRVHGAKTKYFYELLGHNSRLDEIQAAILRVKLKYLDKWNEKRWQNAQYYTQKLSSLDPKILTPYQKEDRSHIYHIYAVRAKSRDKLREYLASCGISSLMHYPYPLHLLRPFKFLGYKKGDFPVAEKVAKETLSLPMYPELSKSQMERVIKKIFEFYQTN